MRFNKDFDMSDQLDFSDGDTGDAVDKTALNEAALSSAAANPDLITGASGFDKSASDMAGSTSSLTSLIGPALAAGASMLGNIGQHTSAGQVASQAINAALGASSQPIAQQMRAAAPYLDAAVAGGMDPASLVQATLASIPQQIRGAIQSTIQDLHAQKASAEVSHAALAATVGAPLEPKLSATLAALNTQQLQQQATGEHKAINRRNRFRETVETKLNRIEARLGTAVDPARARLLSPR